MTPETLKPKFPRVIGWLDPGGTTGMAVWVSDEARHLLSTTGRAVSAVLAEFTTYQVAECDSAEGLKDLFSTLTYWMTLAQPLDGRQQVVIGYETFDFRHDERYRNKIDYTGLEVIGALRAWQTNFPGIVSIHKSGAGLGKGFWNDDKLKRAGLYKPNRTHAMDALRHLLRYLSFGCGRQDLFDRVKLEGS
jgi:hypothetical protein